MVSAESIEEQLKGLGFKVRGWGRGEVSELHHIILEDENIYECVNGIYDGGFALLLATDIRVILVDKKPLSFLTVDDLRFDMINEIDYNHRMMGAYITITTGNKTLVFRSYNKQRLRKLIGHVQHCMAETKKKQSSHQEGQNQHLEQINQQLQAYLVAQYKQQQKLHEQLEKAQHTGSVPSASIPEPIQPNSKLADYLYAHGLLREYQEQTGQILQPGPTKSQVSQSSPKNEPEFPWSTPAAPVKSANADNQLAEIYAEGMQEVFGNQGVNTQPTQPPAASNITATALEVNPLRIAYSKLPMALRNRKFGLGRASFRGPTSRQKPKPEPVA